MLKFSEEEIPRFFLCFLAKKTSFYSIFRTFEDTENSRKLVCVQVACAVKRIENMTLFGRFTSLRLRNVEKIKFHSVSIVEKTKDNMTLSYV